MHWSYSTVAHPCPRPLLNPQRCYRITVLLAYRYWCNRSITGMWTNRTSDPKLMFAKDFLPNIFVSPAYCCLDGHWFSCTLCTIGSLTAPSQPACLTASNTPETINSHAHLAALGYPADLLSAALLADLDSPAGLSTAQCTVASECLAHPAFLTRHAHPGDPAMFVAFSSMAASVAFSSQGAVATLHSTAVPE